MSLSEIVAHKTSGETRSYNVDFVDRMVASTTISSVTSITFAPTGPTSGSQPISGTIVQPSITGGTDDNEYLVTLLVVTSDSQTLNGCFVLQVKDCATQRVS